ncbi:hypothetical protein PMIN07_004806 [Paraphaeosphaeria minitans]
MGIRAEKHHPLRHSNMLHHDQNLVRYNIRPQALRLNDKGQLHTTMYIHHTTTLACHIFHLMGRYEIRAQQHATQQNAAWNVYLATVILEKTQACKGKGIL